MNKNKNKISSLIIAIIVSAVIALPIYFVFIFGFETNNEIFHRPVYLFPPHFNLSYYITAWNFLHVNLLNSFMITAGVLIISLIVILPSAFVLSKMSYRKSNAISFVVIILQMLPAAAVVIPLFLIFYRVGLINSYFGDMLAISTVTIPFGTILLTAFMRNIPFELIEAAVVDGANSFRIFRQIVLPISRSGIVTVGLLTFMFGWGDFIFSVSLLQNQSMVPMSVGLYYFVGHYTSSWNILMAGSMIYDLIPLVVTIIAGRSLLSGLTVGALKE